jgi:hypothetical protein
MSRRDVSKREREPVEALRARKRQTRSIAIAAAAASRDTEPEDEQGDNEDENTLQRNEWNDLAMYLEQTCTQPCVVQETVHVYGDNMLPTTQTNVREWSDPAQLAADLHEVLLRHFHGHLDTAALGDVGNGTIYFFSTDEPNPGDDVIMVKFHIVMPRAQANEQGGIREELWERLRDFWTGDKRLVRSLPVFVPSKRLLARQAHWAAKRQEH